METKVIIPNHYTARLSALDLQTAISVPPGGNWKNVPETLPSKRLASIRADYAAGGGSRSTYYGRLHPDRPSYTINTYFNRPGNGCHLHYDYEGGQHRVLSEREAARLQSFPDSFLFLGNHTEIHKQIGNAVPPLMAFQIARSLPFTGSYLDLFCGAGGLSLGFKWAGWKPIAANDIEESFLATYATNIDRTTICGDLRLPSVFNELVRTGVKNRIKGKPLIILGGPPCQGFSTAGKRRSMEDERNHLSREFKRLVEVVRPDGFIFENVTGLLNMEGGRVFENLKREFDLPGNHLTHWLLKAEEFGIPQRRTRVVLVSLPQKYGRMAAPLPWTGPGRRLPVVSVADALSDLPQLEPGEDGSEKRYSSTPRTAYQLFMRGKMSAEAYVKLPESQ